MAFGFTRTLPTIASSVSNIPILFTEGSFPAASTDGGASSILNGGGNLTAYTDSTKATQLAIQVVSFVTGVTPSVQVLVKLPSAFTGATVYFEADSTQTSQPASASTFGRNAVNDFSQASYRLNNLDDSKGNFDLTTVGAPFNTTDPWGGSSAYDFSGSGQYLRNNAWVRIPDDTLVTCWYRCDLAAATKALWSQGSGAADNWDSLLFRNGTSYEVNRTSSGDNGGAVKSVWTKLDVRLLSGANEVYENGVLIGTNTQTVQSGLQPLLFIGALARASSKLEFDGAISNVVLHTDIPTNYQAWISVEYDNQSDPDNWGISSTWADSGGGGISLSVDSGSYSLTGTDVILIDPPANEVIVIGAGSYSISGTNVNLVADYKEAIPSGSYTYTGTDVILIDPIVPGSITIDSGFYSVTGTPIQTSISSPINTGAYSLSGTAINFVITRGMTIEQGSYIIQGTNINFSNTGNIWTDKPSVVTLWGDQTPVTTNWTDK